MRRVGDIIEAPSDLWSGNDWTQNLRLDLGCNERSCSIHAIYGLVCHGKVVDIVPRALSMLERPLVLPFVLFEPVDRTTNLMGYA